MIHPGINRLYQHINRRYYFPKMKILIRKHVKNCSKCALHKVQASQLPKAIPASKVVKPMEKVYCDVMYNPNEIAAVYKYSVVVAERFSGHAWIEPIEEQTGEEIARALRRIFFSLSYTKIVFC